MIWRHIRFHFPGSAPAVLLAAALVPALSVQHLLARSPAGTTAVEIPEGAGGRGDHLRLMPSRGVIHLWRPNGYDARRAGIVVYVHGYFTDADRTWLDDHLPEQFQASERNALFLAPEAPSWPGDAVRWRDLGTLLREVAQECNEPLPSGPIVLVGHSAAYRTIVNWLREPRVKSVILLDALYRDERQFRRWLRYAPGHESHRLVLVANETARQSRRLARHVPQARKLGRIPDELGAFTAQQRRARLLLLHSQYEHMEIVSSGRVIPLLLGLAPLARLPSPAQAAGSDGSPSALERF